MAKANGKRSVEAVSYTHLRWCHRLCDCDAATSCGEPSHPAPGPHRRGRVVGGGRRCRPRLGRRFLESNRWEYGVLCGMSRFCWMRSRCRSRCAHACRAPLLRERASRGHLPSHDAVSGPNERDEQPARMLAAHVGKRAFLDARWLDRASFRAGKSLRAGCRNRSWKPLRRCPPR